jgi:hypothetical protein
MVDQAHERGVAKLALKRVSENGAKANQRRVSMPWTDWVDSAVDAELAAGREEKEDPVKSTIRIKDKKGGNHA